MGEAARQALRIGLKSIFQKFYSSKGSRNRTSNDINSRGMKRPHEMMNPISKLPSFISAVRGGQGNEETSGNSLFSYPPSSKIGRWKIEENARTKTEDRKAIRKSARRTFLSMMCVSCIGYASREKLALSLHIKGLSFLFPDGPSIEQHLRM